MASDAWAICREIRARAGLSQRALAAKAGVTPATVARIEKGRMEPTFEMLSRLARAAGLDLAISFAIAEEDRTADGLSAEDRLRQNDRLSRLSIHG